MSCFAEASFVFSTPNLPFLEEGLGDFRRYGVFLSPVLKKSPSTYILEVDLAFSFSKLAFINGPIPFGSLSRTGSPI